MEETAEERFGQGYLQERKLVKRWPGPVPAIASLVLTLIIFYASWWIFQDPRGVFRNYTPYVGFSHTTWWLIALVWMTYVFNYWPFRREWLEKAHPLAKGAVLTFTSFVIVYVFIALVFEGILGNLGLAYFSESSLMKLEGVTDFFANEYAAFSCLMFATIAAWLSPAWIVACEEAPWQDLQQPTKGFSIWVMTFFLTTIIYFLTVHSHMSILYYPWQEFAAITPPWWQSFANTVSGAFHLGWIVCCIVSLWMVETIWGRFPFILIRRAGLRRLATFFGIIAIAFCMYFFFHFIQELAWGEAIRGTRRLMATDWRWLHSAEIAVFFLVPALFIYFYCGNWPNKYSLAVNALIRTIIAAAAAIVFYILYYKTSHLFLGTQKGFSHPQQFPMIPMIWLVNIWLVHHWFMDNWPGWKMVPKTAGEIAADREAEKAKIEEFGWSPDMGVGLGVGAVAGVLLFFVAVWATPLIASAVNTIPE